MKTIIIHAIAKNSSETMSRTVVIDEKTTVKDLIEVKDKFLSLAEKSIGKCSYQVEEDTDESFTEKEEEMLSEAELEVDY